jgi:hypothetical protein
MISQAGLATSCLFLLLFLMPYCDSRSHQTREPEAQELKSYPWTFAMHLLGYHQHYAPCQNLQNTPRIFFRRNEIDGGAEHVFAKEPVRLSEF